MKKVFCFCLVLVIICSTVNCQVRTKTNKNYSGEDSIAKEKIKRSIAYAKSIPVDSTIALNDIASHHIKFYCRSGRGGQGRTNEDTDFENRFSVHYLLFGCVIWQPERQIIAYNNMMAAYLDRMYGTAWRTLARRDIVGVTK